MIESHLSNGGKVESERRRKETYMFIPTDTEVKVRNTEGKVIPKVLFTLARKWQEVAESAGVPLAGSPEEVRAVLPNGTLGFSPEDAKVIQGVAGNGAKLFAEAFSEVTGAKWSASDRISSEEHRNPVKYSGTIQKGDRKGEKVTTEYSSLHRAGNRNRKVAKK